MVFSRLGPFAKTLAEKIKKANPEEYKKYKGRFYCPNLEKFLSKEQISVLNCSQKVH